MNIHTHKTSKNKSSSASKTESATLTEQEPTFQFEDNRPESVTQRKLQEMADNYSVQHNNLENADDTIAQLARVKDPNGARTFVMYAQAISNTGSKKILETTLANPQLLQGANTGIFLSDTMGESSQATWVGDVDDEISLWLPDKDYFLLHPDEMIDIQKTNGLTVAQNCDLVAEHEIIHFMQARANIKGAGPLAGTAKTAAASFTDAKIKTTLSNLKHIAGFVDKKKGMQIARLAAPKAFLLERINYIKTTYEAGKGNIEAPTVVRELRKYLETGGWTGDTFAELYGELVKLDDECTAIHKAQPEKKGCFLTTACVDFMGKTDDCEELQALRAFRDGYMQTQPEGQALITEYYHIAPGIVDTIADCDNADHIYLDLYERLVCNSIVLIKAGQEEEAMKNYSIIVRELLEKYSTH